MDFKIIETQKEFEKRIKDRIRREKDILKKQTTEFDIVKLKNEELIGLVENLTAQLDETSKRNAEFETTILALNSKIKSYETNSVKMRIALETGLPLVLSKRLSGEDPESIRKDAERLLGIFQTFKPIEPVATAEGDFDI